MIRLHPYLHVTGSVNSKLVNGGITKIMAHVRKLLDLWQLGISFEEMKMTWRERTLGRRLKLRWLG